VSSTILAIDVGNTRTKWGVFDAAGELKAHGALATDGLDTLEESPAWAGAERVVISNVAGSKAKQSLDRLLQRKQRHYVQASSFSCGVRNEYQNPAQLGSDRWAALIAAWHHYREPAVVVSVGTAVTIDALGSDSDSGIGVFLGGFILPGLHLMQQSIADKAPGVKIGEGSLQVFPRNTGDALYNGSINAIVGAIHALENRLQAKENALPKIVIAGGDAEAIHELLALDSALVKRLAIADNLVLQGLLILESETR
jgi:type III pantothenate kinase